MFQGQKLRAARAAAGLTQKQLSELAQVRRETVSHAETGEHVPEAEAIARMARALGLPIDRLFSDDASTVADDALADGAPA